MQRRSGGKLSASKLPAVRPRAARRIVGGKVRPVLVAGVLLLAAAVGGGWWWWKTQQPASEGATADAAATAAPKRFGSGSRVQPVSVATVQQRDMAATLQAIGNMAALNTAVVRTRVDGEIKALHFKEGDRVRAGQLLAELDNRAQQVQLAQAQGQLARDQALLKNAQLDLARYKDLLAKDSIASQQVDTQEALVNQLKGTVQADQAAVDNAQLQLSYTRLTAPIAGRLGLRQADMGSLLRTGDANGLVTITQTQPIALVFAVPETQIRRLRTALNKRENLPVEVWDRDFRQQLGEGKVVTMDNAIDAATGTIKVKAEFPNADGSLFPNQFVNVRMTLAVEKDALAVPHTAVQRGAQGAFVYVVLADGKVSVRRVRIGATDGDWVAVSPLSGELVLGDKVVTDGADRLREGAQVEVITPPPARQGAGAIGATGSGAPSASATAPLAGSVGVQGAAASPGAAPAAALGATAGAAAAQLSSAPGKPEATGPSIGAPAQAPAAPAQPAPAGSANPPRQAAEQPQPASGAGGAPTPRADGLPPWFDRLPPEMQERFKAMNPEERKAFIEQMRERRRQREAQGG